VLVGTTAARLALGDDPDGALATGVAAAALSVSGMGGTGYLPRLEESLAAAHRAEGHRAERHQAKGRPQ
jgi:2-dehydro-3-deoxygluconokinase